MNILLAEDAALLRDQIVFELRDIPGVERVEAASSVREAREALTIEAFDLWVLDFELRDGTALDLLEDRRALDEARRPAVIVSTIHTSPLLRDRCLDAGAGYFYSKADDWEDLLEVVTSLAAGRAARPP